MQLSHKIAIGVAALLSVLSIVVLTVSNTGKAPQRATILPTPMPLPQFHLIDQDNAPLTRDSLQGRQTLLFFGFTHCPDICPATLQQLALARQELRARVPGGTPLPDILLISVDPERDSPDTLKAYTGYFGPGTYGATGDPAELAALASALGIFFSKDDQIDADYTVSHSAAVLLLNRRAELQAVFSAPHDVDSFVADLLILMDPT